MPVTGVSIVLARIEFALQAESVGEAAGVYDMSNCAG